MGFKLAGFDTVQMILPDGRLFSYGLAGLDNLSLSLPMMEDRIMLWDLANQNSGMQCQRVSCLYIMTSQSADWQTGPVGNRKEIPIPLPPAGPLLS